MSSNSDTSDESFDEEMESSSDEEEDNDPKTDENIKDVEDEEEDETIKKIRLEQQKKRNHPPDLEFEDHIVDICFHPTKDIIAVASIVGDVLICKYNNEETSVIDTWELHVKPCRDIEFDEDGIVLYSTSKDKSIMVTDVESGKLKKFIENAHEVPVNRISILDENCIATGDDDGRVRFWDLRDKESKPIYQVKKHDDFISDMITDINKTFLVCASGDGSISSIDLKNRAFFLQSEQYDEEFTSLGLFRGDSKLLASSSKGKLFLFNWREFGYHSDQFPGPKQSINKIIPVTESIVVTGNEDGYLRSAYLFPHHHLGIVGQHQMSVDCMDISNNGTLIASTSFKNDLKFWNVTYFDNFRLERPKIKKSKTQLTNNLPSSKQTNRKDFFADLNT